jgi:hypothetical protein
LAGCSRSQRAIPCAAHCTTACHPSDPKPGSTVDSFVFQEHMHEGQTSASVPSTAPLAELGGPGIRLSVEESAGAAARTSPNRSLEWPHTLAGDAPSEPFMILSTVTTAGTQAKSASGLHFGVSFRRSPIKTRHRAFFALAELQAEHWEHLWSHDAILQ